MTEIEGKVAETYAQSSPTLPDHVLNGTPTERDAWELEQRGLIRMKLLATFQPDLPASGHDAHVGISAGASDDGDEEPPARAAPPRRTRRRGGRGGGGGGGGRGGLGEGGQRHQGRERGQHRQRQRRRR